MDISKAAKRATPANSGPLQRTAQVLPRSSSQQQPQLHHPPKAAASGLHRSVQPQRQAPLPSSQPPATDDELVIPLVTPAGEPVNANQQNKQDAPPSSTQQKQNRADRSKVVQDLRNRKGAQQNEGITTVRGVLTTQPTPKGASQGVQPHQNTAQRGRGRRGRGGRGGQFPSSREIWVRVPGQSPPRVADSASAEDLQPASPSGTPAREGVSNAILLTPQASVSSVATDWQAVSIKKKRKDQSSAEPDNSPQAHTHTKRARLFHVDIQRLEVTPGESGLPKAAQGEERQLVETGEKAAANTCQNVNNTSHDTQSTRNDQAPQEDAGQAIPE